MAGGHVKYRHLSRKSSHRKALLRNLVASLFEHESIQTTWPKAKEAQRFAEKLITLGKKNTNGSRNAAWRHFYVCIEQYHSFTISRGALLTMDLHSNRKSISQNSSANYAYATPTDQAGTRVSSTSNRSKKTKLHPRF